MHTRNDNGLLPVEIGKGLTIPVDIDALAQCVESIDHVLYIGLRNILMDAHAGVTAKSFPELSGDDLVTAMRNDSMALSQKKLDALMRNEVRATTGHRVSTVDQVAVEAKKIALAVLRRQKVSKPSAEQITAMMANPKVLDMARAAVAELDALAAPLGETSDHEEAPAKTPKLHKKAA